jgi:AraC-like DNA-binding protein
MNQEVAGMPHLPMVEHSYLPDAAPDVLTDVLEELQLRSFVAGRTVMQGPWNIRVPEGDGAFYAISDGACWLQSDGVAQPLRLEPGDLVVLPHGQAHQLYDSPRAQAKPQTDHSCGLPGSVLGRPQPRPVAMPAPAVVGSGVSRLVCGRLVFHRHSTSPLMTSLPPVIHVHGKARNTEWLADTLRMIARETTERLPGAQTVINRLAYVLFVQAVRAYVAALPSDASNWMRALHDPAIRKALGVMHARPEHAWSVATLAEEVAMSRSVFAAQFSQLVGEPPLQYLTALRMRKASDLLRDKASAIKQVAARVGYGSEASFGNAFKRWWGVAPGAYRRRPEAGHLAVPATAGRHAESNGHDPDLGKAS